jgi:hypothetical protein
VGRSIGWDKVPSVRITGYPSGCRDVGGYRNGDWVPVIPIIHEDVEIGGTFPHIHYDRRYTWRNVPDGFIMRPEHLMQYHRAGFKPVLVIRKKWHKLCRIEFAAAPESIKEGRSRQIVMLKMLHPNASTDCLRCPHRGTSLEGYPISMDGKITCPMHGLEVKVR